MKKNRFLLASMISAGIASSASAWAAPFPSRPVTIVVPYSTGGGTDTLARRMAKTLSGHWHVPVIVENIPGADGLIGTERVLRKPADGYTLLLQVSQIMMWKKTQPNSHVDIPRDFRFVSEIQTSPLAFGVSPTLPVKSLGEFVQWCKANAKTACSWGTATDYGRLIGMQFMDEAGLKDAANIPYKGTAPMMTDVAGNHISMEIPSIASSLAQIKGGLFHLLAVGSEKRSAFAPDVPTLKETGYSERGKDWYGMLVAKGTPRQAFDTIVEGIKFASKDASLVEQIRVMGGEPVFSSPQEFERDVEHESKQLNQLLNKYWGKE